MIRKVPNPMNPRANIVPHINNNISYLLNASWPNYNPNAAMDQFIRRVPGKGARQDF
jgi:hypothetical protein